MNLSSLHLPYDPSNERKKKKKNTHARTQREKDRKLAAEHPRLISHNWSGSFAARVAMLIEEKETEEKRDK